MMHGCLNTTIQFLCANGGELLNNLAIQKGFDVMNVFEWTGECSSLKRPSVIQKISALIPSLSGGGAEKVFSLIIRHVLNARKLK